MACIVGAGFPEVVRKRSGFGRDSVQVDRASTPRNFSVGSLHQAIPGFASTRAADTALDWGC